MKALFIKYKEIITYIFFGVVTTVLNWGLYALFTNVLKTSVFFSNAASWVIVIIVAFVTNKLFVFESKSPKPKVLLKEASSFLASRAVTGVVEIVGVPLLASTGFDNLFYAVIEKMNLSATILFTPGIYSKIALAVIVVILNYVFSKLFVFKNKKKEQENSK